MLKESIETSFLHFKRAKDNYDDILKFQLNVEIYEDKEKIKTIDAFIFRFIKLQDFMGNKLFKTLLMRIGEYRDNMSLIDILDKLEKLEIINDADKWIDFRMVRNSLTHEYPDNEKDVIDGIKKAILFFKDMEVILQNIKRYVNDRGLIGQ